MDKKYVMLGRVVEKIVGLPLEILGVLYDLVEKLAGDSQEWLSELKKFLRKEKCWTNVIIETLLDFVGTVTIPARTAKFIARDNFVVDTSKKAKVKISWLGDNFKENFLAKIEDAMAGTNLLYQKLKKGSRDIPIINELGGEDKAETMLAEIFAAMELQPNGESGALLANGYANIFYIRDDKGVLWAVLCYWRDGGWRVNAHSVEGPGGWDAGRQVFSRNSSDAQSE